MHTLLILTHNRPDMLRALLAYLSESKLSICVLDSSSVDIQHLNKCCVSELPQATHRSYAPEIHPLQKWLDGIRRVQTPYSSLLADDDLVFPDVLLRCVQALEARPDAVAAHGVYLKFSYQDDHPHFVRLSLEYGGKSIESDRPGERLTQLLTRYESTVYAVYRTSVLEATFSKLMSLNGGHYQELYQATATVLKGNVLRLPEVYLARRDGDHQGSHSTDCMPWAWIGQNPFEFFSAYLPYRQEVLECWRECDKAFSRELHEKWCDAVHYLYLQRAVCREWIFHYFSDMLPHDRLYSESILPKHSERFGCKVRRVLWHERPWRRPLQNFAKVVHKMTDRTLGRSSDGPRLAERNFRVDGAPPVVLDDNLLAYHGSVEIRKAVESLQRFVRLNLDVAKRAA